DAAGYTASDGTFPPGALRALKPVSWGPARRHHASIGCDRRRATPSLAPAACAVGLRSCGLRSLRPRRSTDMPAGTRYSGEWGISSLASRLLGVVADARRMRRGFHSGTPRPATWAERSTAVPDRPSDLAWARMEPVRSIRYGIQKGLSAPF